ncbi:outer membrane lipoprotein carrier protein LolA [Endomicrobium proavitum]|nr:outer membrane lipoprotein carrier protein LolA [Endomicrobium proavitum]
MAIKKISLCVLFLFFFMVFSYAGNIDDIFKDFSSVQTIASSFTMEKYLSISQKPFISSGKFYFKNPDFLKWQYFAPFEYGFMIDGNKTFSWQYNNNGKREVKDISNQPMAKAMVSQLYVFIVMDKDSISKTYKIEESEGGIVLYPKDNSTKQMIENIKIIFSSSIAAVRKVVILNRNGDKTIITFSGTEINKDLPENVRVI